MPTGEKIHFHFIQGGFGLAGRKNLKEFLVGLFKKEKTALSRLDYIFCSDKFLLRLNQEFLDHSDFTDILTFPLSAPGEPVTAEIYISIPRVRENAVQFRSRFGRELKRVIIHGALHLCGFQDKSRPQASRMREREDYYLQKLL